MLEITYMAAGDAVGPAGLARLILLAVLLLLLLFLAVLVLRNVKYRANSQSSRKRLCVSQRCVKFCRNLWRLISDLVKLKVRSSFKAKIHIKEIFTNPRNE